MQLLQIELLGKLVNHVVVDDTNRLNGWHLIHTRLEPKVKKLFPYAPNFIDVIHLLRK